MDIERRLRQMRRRPEVEAAVSFIRAADAETIVTQVELSEIPAPPFREARRAGRVAELLGEVGLAPDVDDVGNVVAVRPGKANEALLVVSAHLDTVFPPGTDVSVTREGDLLRGPGISDDARGLAALVALARALEAGSVRTTSPVLFAATVGEEGAGDLRGVKRLFSPGGPARGASGFISLDGAGADRIVVDGLGSRRYRITARGPGGHSWLDWGTENPIRIISRLGNGLTELTLPSGPRTTLTLARIGGGTSINAIPQEAWVEIDTRSAANDHIDELEESIRDLVRRCQAEHDTLTLDISVIGDRPAGKTDREAPLVSAAVAATRAQGIEPILALSSTDANVPMALGIPAVTLGCGGEAGQSHTTDEWYRNVRGPEGIVRALDTLLLVAGMGGQVGPATTE